MPGPFEHSDFASEEEQVNADEHFESTHSPTLSYTHIEKSLKSLESGLDEFEGRERVEARVYANVTVFREVMQYLEEFGIYLYSRLDPEEDFIEAITGTRPTEVKGIFEPFRDGNFDTVIDDYREGTTFDEWLKQELGYNIIQQDLDEASLDEIADPDEEIAATDMEEAISISLSAVKDQLQQIASFFLRFDDPYNAIKHGARVTPMIDFEFEVSGLDNQISIDVDEDYVSFLCRTSGSRRGGDVYTFIAPVQPLREQATVIASLTKSLYTHIYELRQSVEESRRTGEEVTLNPSFYGITESDGDGASFDFKEVSNSDSSIWIPESAVPDEIRDYELPTRNKVAVGLHDEDDEMVVKTEADNTPSYEYPLLTEVEMKSDTENLIGMQITQEFSFELYNLPLWQYFEIRSLDAESIDSISLNIESEDVSDSFKLDENMSPPSLPEPNFPELLEFMRFVGLASETEVWIPCYWPPRVLQVVNFYNEEYDLTRDVAEELLEGIDQLTAEEVATVSSVSIVDTTGEGDPRIVRHSELGMRPGGVVVQIDDNNGGQFQYSIVKGSDPDYERGETGSPEGVGVLFLDETPERAFEKFENNGMEAIDDLSNVASPEDANSILEVRRVYGPKLTWYHVDRFEFGLYEELPPHIEATIED